MNINIGEFFVYVVVGVAGAIIIILAIIGLLALIRGRNIPDNNDDNLVE